MVRLKDIAARAGVSVMTVSKALRGEKDVAAATRAKVKLLAEQMGYVPDSAAQGLRNRTTKLFGVVISSISNPLFPRMLRALEEHAHELGCELIVMQTNNSPEREEICIRRLLSRRVDGMFISPVYRIEPEARIYRELLARGTPVVLLGHPATFCDAFPSVATDDATAGYNTTKHLLDLGHQRIAFLSGRLVAPWARERLEGYRRALREAGLEPDDRLVFNAGGTVEDGVKAGLQMLNEGCNATAIQAVNDLVAVGCAETFLGQGLKIPGDISVTGFGNILVSEHFRVPLTTVRQPKFRLGVAAMELMGKLLRRDRAESRRLHAELVVRQSTAAPRAK
ncbi:MAG: LacI family transcriptional regulator [Pedosphaera sp.]|nr:LacI family transcriptional regulator [Pedosphaera sp.]